MSMTYHDFAQGSADWHQHRATHFNASDAPAMMGCSPYQTRTELLTRLKSGLCQDVDDATQRRFDDGHRFEALARPLAEKIIGQDLYPVTGSSGKLSASFDGLTMDESTAFEHKSLNDSLRYTPWDEGNGDHLPLHYRVQMEHQMIVSGAELVLFMASKWNGEELVEERHCWYTSDAELRAKIIAGWKQFEIDLAEFVPAAVEAKAAGRAPETLPALHVQVTGMVTASNLNEFREHAMAVLDGINRDLQTDADFADAEKTVKWCGDVEARLKAAKDNVLGQMADVDAVIRTLDDVSAETRRIRLDLDKLVKTEKERRKADIVQDGAVAVRQHINTINATLPERHALGVSAGLNAELAASIKGMRSLDSIRDAVSTAVSNFKISYSEQADRVRACLAVLDEFKDHSFLFPDARSLCASEQPDGLRNLAKVRVLEHQAKEQKRQEAERERIAQEERAKAEAVVRQAQADADTARKAEKPIIKIDGPVTNSTPAPTQPDTGARLTLGQINERIAPVSITVAGLAQLGFDPVEQVKASRLYRESDLPAICRAISSHLLRTCATATA